MRITSIRSWSFAAIAASLLLSTFAHAASINYGDGPIIPPGVRFERVTESSGTDPVPLFGAPDYFRIGMDFDPTSFVAFSTNGVHDVTDGQLNFTVDGSVSGPNIFAIESLTLSESGDYTLAGVGTSATMAIAGASIRISVTEIDGVKVEGSAIRLSPTSESVEFNLLANRGVVRPWSLRETINISDMLDARNIDYQFGATEIQVVINNQLLALSEANSVATIAKKDFEIEIGGDGETIPEPATVSILALGFAGALMRRRGR